MWECLARVLPAALVMAVVGGCTLEERPDRPAEEDTSDASDAALADDLPGDEVDGTAADSARAVASAFREALELGDLSSALQLLDGEAVVYDRVGGDPPEGASTGEILLRQIRLQGDGLSLEPLESEFTLHGETAVEVTYSEASWDGDNGRAGMEGAVVETMLLVRTEDGWRLAHLHRSVEPAGG